MRRLGWLFCALLAISVQTARAQSDNTFRFIHITDTHLTASANIEPLQKLVSDLNAMNPRPAFVVDTGDVTEAGRPEEYQRFLEGTTGLSIPFYCAPGNHDVRWAPLGKEAFTQAFKRRYQSFDHGGCHFVILDSTVLLEHWGHFDSEQLKWLQSDLRKLPRDTPVFVFFHHWVGRENPMVDNQEDLLRILAPYNVVAMLQGHGHADIQWLVNGIQCVMARGLYQGSYDMVDVAPHEATILRVRKEDAGKPPQTIAKIPLHGRPRRGIVFNWDDPNIPVLARRRFTAALHRDEAPSHESHEEPADDKPKAEYQVDGGAWSAMEPDERPEPRRRRGRDRDYMAQFSTSGLGSGAHRLLVRMTAPDGETYQHEESFVVEQVSGAPKNAWTFRAGDTVQSSPSLVGDTVYATSLDNSVYAIDAKTGKKRWSTATKGAILATPLVANSTIYVGSMDHNFYALDSSTGHVRWRYDAGAPIFATAAIANGTVCFGANRKIVGLDANNGKERWTQPAGSFFQSRATAADGVFYLGGWDNTLYALDAATGSPHWETKMGRTNGGRGDLSFYYSPAIASPSVGDGHVFVCTDDGVLHAVNVQSGHDDWIARAPQGGDSFGYSSPAFADGRVYVGGLGKHGDCYAFEARNGELVWRCSTGFENYDSSPTLAGDTVVIGSVQGKVSWIDAASGKLKWQYGLDPGYCFSTPNMSGALTYVTSMNGSVYAIQTP